MTEEIVNNVIMDTGSWTCKLGVSNEDFPRVMIQTVTSEPGLSTELLFGKNAIDGINTSGITTLMRGGTIADWDLMELFWKNAFKSALQVESPNSPLLVNYYSNSNKYTKEKQTQIFFENFNVSNYFAISNSVLVLYSSGRVNGLVVDSGHAVTSVVPVIDGTAHYYNQSVSNYAGNDITEFFVNSNLPIKILSQEIKEKYCRISLDFEREIADNRNTPGQNVITLPDGNTFDLRDYPIRAPEGIFYPNVIGKKGVGITDIILNAYSKCDQDVRKDLLNGIILAGGNTCFLNFNERLQKELQIRTPSNTKIKCINYSDKITSLWFGGAVVSSLGSLQPMWIAKSDYDEHGPSIIHRRSI